MFDKILVCLDGSELAEQIFPYVKEMAKRFGGKLFLAHFEELRHGLASGPEAMSPYSTLPDVYEISTPLTPAPVLDMPTTSGEEMTKKEIEVEDYLEQVASLFHAEGLIVECVLHKFTGKIGKAIVDYAHHNEMDLVAISTHGRSGIKRALLGSVADYVIRHLELPVLVMKPGEIKSI